MVKAGNRCELVVTEGGSHGLHMKDRILWDETLKKSDAFIESLGWGGAKAEARP